MEYFKKILKYALPYKHFAFLNIIANIFYAFFGTLSMISLFPMLKVLFNQTETLTTAPQWTGISNIVDYSEAYLNYFVTLKKSEGNDDVLIFMILIIVSTFLLKNLFNYLSLFFITYLRNGVIKDVRNELYDKITELSVSYYSGKKKGDVLSRISSDVIELQTSFLGILELIVKEPLMIIFTLASMILINSKLALFVFIFIPISGLIISFIGKSLKRKSNKVQKEQGLFLSLVDETLNGLKIIKSFTSESLFKKKFNDSTKKYYDFSNSLLNRTNLAGPISEFLGICSITILLWYGGQMVLVDNSLDPSSFMVFLGLAYNILTPFKAISKASYKVKKGNAAAERVLQVLDNKSLIEDPKNNKQILNFQKSIEFKNVNFSYNNENAVKEFSFNLKKGETLALVGQSGSGKSTIANLVNRFYDIKNGEILIDGLNIKTITKNSLRKLIGLVTQDSILFNDTIKNNLLVAQNNATDDEIIEALKIANAWEFVKEFSDGIYHNVGDSGNKLSGGQKQRLSIARAVLKNPPIMVLDEATSALDPESEKLVQNALEKMTMNRTSIVIAHRLSTIKNAKHIAVLDRGCIVEKGNHEELMKLKGVYYKYVNMQSLEK
ncbi:MAG: ABC transporter ATP-binding protein [Flavobacteriales bacterium]|nr:ABC transporter ATP-binding protein [Flavobacteriaceae bacterium]RZO97198.1 MAG: ABC transporter ATP-binding protein [Flavobacteriales bacterium]